MKQRVMYLFANAYQEQCRKLNIQITPKRVQEYFLGIIDEAVEYREKNNIRRNDYFDMLLQLKNTGKLEGDATNIGKISYTDLTSACFVFFLAGKESSLKQIVIFFKQMYVIIFSRLRDIINSTIICSL